MPRYTTLNSSSQRVLCASFQPKKYVGYVSGLLFAVGWWIFIDAIVYDKGHPAIIRPTIQDFIPGIISTFALITVNMVNRKHLSGNEYESNGNAAARGCAFFGLTISIGAIGYSTILCGVKYGGDGIIGWSLVAQSLLIFISSMIMWGFSSNPEDESISLY